MVTEESQKDLCEVVVQETEEEIFKFLLREYTDFQRGVGDMIFNEENYGPKALKNILDEFELF